jgi:hypothetical protein
MTEQDETDSELQKRKELKARLMKEREEELRAK